MFDLGGRVALVTGAGQGVGAGVAGSLAAQGATVAVNDLHADRAAATVDAVTAAGGTAVVAAFDVTDAAAVDEAIGALEADVGPVDILVNNAGIPAGMAMVRFAELDPDDWAQYVDLNLYGVLHCTRAVLDGMVDRGWGRIVVISSDAAQVGAQFGISLYGAAKSAALGWMRHLAQEAARSGVTVNALALGLMAGADGSAETDAVARTIPVGRLGEPADVGAAVVYLASEEASWTTGQTIGVNGGSIT